MYKSIFSLIMPLSCICRLTPTTETCEFAVSNDININTLTVDTSQEDCNYVTNCHLMKLLHPSMLIDYNTQISYTWEQFKDKFKCIYGALFGRSKELLVSNRINHKQIASKHFSVLISRHYNEFQAYLHNHSSQNIIISTSEDNSQPVIVKPGYLYQLASSYLIYCINPRGTLKYLSGSADIENQITFKVSLDFNNEGLSLVPSIHKSPIKQLPNNCTYRTECPINNAPTITSLIYHLPFKVCFCVKSVFPSNQLGFGTCPTHSTSNFFSLNFNKKLMEYTMDCNDVPSNYNQYIQLLLNEPDTLNKVKTISSREATDVLISIYLFIYYYHKNIIEGNKYVAQLFSNPNEVKNTLNAEVKVQNDEIKNGIIQSKSRCKACNSIFIYLPSFSIHSCASCKFPFCNKTSNNYNINECACELKSIEDFLGDSEINQSIYRSLFTIDYMDNQVETDLIAAFIYQANLPWNQLLAFICKQLLPHALEILKENTPMLNVFNKLVIQTIYDISTKKLNLDTIKVFSECTLRAQSTINTIYTSDILLRENSSRICSKCYVQMIITLFKYFALKCSSLFPLQQYRQLCFNGYRCPYQYHTGLQHNLKYNHLSTQSKRNRG